MTASLSLETRAFAAPLGHELATARSDKRQMPPSRSARLGDCSLPHAPVTCLDEATEAADRPLGPGNRRAQTTQKVPSQKAPLPPSTVSRRWLQESSHQRSERERERETE